MDSSRISTALILLPCVLAAGGCSGSRASESAIDAIAGLRTALEKYQDVNTALADGYERDALDICETPAHMGVIEDLGAMGIHYLRRDLLGIEAHQTRLDVSRAHTDFLRPAGLIYEPQADKSLALVAVENVVSAAAWDAAGHQAPPAFYDTPFRRRPADVGMQTEAQYELQIWLFRDNPSGMFAPYNPQVTCEHHEYNMPMYHPPPDLLPGETAPAHPH